eukprot:m.60791 g.60791  ORF g.60791 m.60791 type:complete len:52 (-) comp9527_c0_seq2:1963-2118(-)
MGMFGSTIGWTLLALADHSRRMCVSASVVAGICSSAHRQTWKVEACRNFEI